MSDKTGIEWADATWNPVSGCSKVSEGCRNCYAERVSQRFGTTDKPWTHANACENVKLHPERLDQPIRWRKHRKIFVDSMSDLFHEQVPDSFIDKVFAVMAMAHQHEFQVLTKRPDRMNAYMKSARVRIGAAIEEIAPAYCGYDVFADDVATGSCWPIPDIWLGVSVEDQRAADERIPLLLQTPAIVRFLSCEPLLGPVDLTSIISMNGLADTVLSPECWGDCACDSAFGYDPGCRRNGGDGTLTRRIDWVIAGGESGPGARPIHPDWVRSLRDQCAETGVPFLFKQWGEWMPADIGNVDHASAHHFLGADGEDFTSLPIGEYPSHVEHMVKVGKKIAGRILDGETWDGYPLD